AGESRTDWARVDALTDADIDRAIASDPDAAPRLGKWFWDNAELLSAAAAADKIPVTLRVDRDVVQCFKELGPGYQSRMNAVLRAYALAHSERPNANTKSDRT
ncbi:MAG: BrnA antitoxin family protein, partial [Gemmatimonadaceae bacterium]